MKTLNWSLQDYTHAGQGFLKVKLTYKCEPFHLHHQTLQNIDTNANYIKKKEDKSCSNLLIPWSG